MEYIELRSNATMKKVISPYIMLYFVMCLLQIKVIRPYIMLHFVVCMLQIGPDKNKSNKSLYNVILCSLYVTRRSR